MHTNIYILGDSVAFGESNPSGGWPQELSSFVVERYAREGGKEFRIYNLSIGSERTREVLARMEGELAARGAKDHENIIIFAVGLNDSAFVHSKNGNWIDFDGFKGNVKKLVVAGERFSKTIIFVGLTPANEKIVDPMPWDTDKSYRNEDIKKYDRALREMAEGSGAGFIPIFEKFMAADYKKLLHDGAHPNSRGQELIFETVRDYLINKKTI